MLRTECTPEISVSDFRFGVLDARHWCMANDDAAELIRRATALRLLALRLGWSKARWLSTLAGSETWIGPTPSLCREDLRRVRVTIERAADDLAAAALRLESQARDLSAGSGAGAPGMRVG